MVLLGAFWAGPAFAVLPDEILPDPALETRARDISAGIRCLVCQNQSIDDSEADLARDLRLLIRERLSAGDTDAEVIDYLVARYGAFVLLKPPLDAGTLLLWGAPIAFVVIGGLLAFAVIRRRAPSTLAADLSADERRRLEALLAEPPPAEPRGGGATAAVGVAEAPAAVRRSGEGRR